MRRIEYFSKCPLPNLPQNSVRKLGGGGGGGGGTHFQEVGKGFIILNRLSHLDLQRGDSNNDNWEKVSHLIPYLAVDLL